MERIYLASWVQDQPRMRELKACLEKLGYRVVSSWVEAAFNVQSDEAALGNSVWAHRCEEDVHRCDTIVVMADDPVRGHGNGGHHTELGIARALEKTVYVVGAPEQVLHHLREIKWFVDIPALLQFLQDKQYASWYVQK